MYVSSVGSKHASYQLISLYFWGNVSGCAFVNVIFCSGFSPLGTYLALKSADSLALCCRLTHAQHPVTSVTLPFLTSLPIHSLRTLLSPSWQMRLLGFLLGGLVCHCLTVSYILVQISQPSYKQHCMTVLLLTAHSSLQMSLSQQKLNHRTLLCCWTLYSTVTILNYPKHVTCTFAINL